MKTTSELLERFVELFNDDRFDEMPDDYASDAIAEEIGTHRRVSPEESAEDARAWREAFPDARGTITTKVVDGNKGAAEIVWRGTNSGPFMGQLATGKPVTVSAVVIIETAGGKITRSTHYIDIAGMMEQLGVSPQVETAG
jgi:steroid delta-isomerase-like uncharacterized protein